jgi:acyl-CoA thioesterase I
MMTEAAHSAISGSNLRRKAMSIFRSMWCSGVLAFATSFACPGLATAEDAPITIVDLGDSYIIGYGIAAGETFPVRLQAALDATGRAVKVVDTGFVGTSQVGLRWLTKTPVGMALLAKPAGHALILELGQNDCRRFTLDQTRANLDGILAELAAKKIPVLVVGTAAYGYCGADYIAAFPEVFRGLAAKYGDLLYPDFKEGVTGHSELIGSDGDHPNSAGEAIVVERMLPSVLELIDRVGKP